MTIGQVLTFSKTLKPTELADGVLVRFLSEVEGTVQKNILHLSQADLVVYDDTTDVNTKLLVDPPHDKLYGYYVCAMIDFSHGDYTKYQNTMDMFNACYGEFGRWYHRAYGCGFPEEAAYVSAYAIAVKHGYVGTEAQWIAQYQQSVDAANLAAAEAAAAAAQCRELAVQIPGLEASSREAALQASQGATLSRSWAVGGTGVRPGEDRDNARYWAGEAHKAAGGGVVSFNGRTGSVIPAAGDYTAADIQTSDGKTVETSLSNKEPAGLKSDITLYVNAATGNDANSGITADFAKKTIMAAVGSLPKNSNLHSVTINVAPGVYSEDVLIEGFSNISHSFGLQLLGATGKSETHQIQRVYIGACSGGDVYVRGFRAKGVTSPAPTVHVVSARCRLEGMVCIAGTSHNGMVVQSGALVTCVNASFSGFGNVAVYAFGASVVVLHGISGTGNLIGLRAGSTGDDPGGIITKSNVTIEATTAESKAYGGQILG